MSAQYSINQHLHGDAIAIIIDCWDTMLQPNSSHRDIFKQLYNNILLRISQIPNLAAVVLASYATKEFNNGDLQTNNFYYKNSWSLFYHEQTDDYIKKRWIQDAQIAMKQNFWRYNATDPMILNYKWNCMQLAMLEKWQLEYFIHSMASTVTKLFYFGKAWKICIHGRPIGVDAMLRSKHNIASDDFGIFVYRDGVLWCDEHGKNNISFQYPDLAVDTTCRPITKDLFEIIQ